MKAALLTLGLLAAVPVVAGAQTRPEAPQAAQCIAAPIKLIQGVTEVHDTGIQLGNAVYDVTGASADSYPERVGVTQFNEQWIIEVGGVQVYGPTPDLADRVADTFERIVGSFVTTGGRVVIKHVAQVQATDGTPNSVSVASLCFNVRPAPTTSTTPSTTQVPATTVPVVSTIAATVPPSTWTPDPPAYAVVTTTTAAPTTTAPVVIATSSTVLERSFDEASAVLPMVEATPAVPYVGTPSFTG